MIKQNIFKFWSESRVCENEHTLQEKARCISWFIETKSDIQTQRKISLTELKSETDLQHRIIEAIDTVTADILAEHGKKLNIGWISYMRLMVHT